MNTMAWLFILAAAVVVRGVFKGRVVELPMDIKDMLLGALTGDFEAVKEAAGRSGEGLAPTLAAESSATASGTAGGGTGKGASLLAEVRRLGTGKKYVWGGTFSGTRGGDCSGLVWRALKNLGYYKGPRFVTSTFPSASRSFATVVTSPAAGDICVWQRGGVKGHMGVVSGNGQFFSALSTKSGVKDASISAITGRLTYYRLK